MNRYLFYLIALVLLNHCIIAQDDQIEGIEACTSEGEPQTECSDRIPNNPLYKCQDSGNGCTHVPKTCEEANEIENMDGVDCNKISTNDVICLSGTEGCVIASTCDAVVSNANEQICQKFSDSINKCDFVGANTENEENNEAHCKSRLRECTESLEQTDENKENICSTRSTDEKYCYFNGDNENPACKEASECANIELAEGKGVSQETCDRYNQDIDVNTAENKCAPDDNKCIIKPFCDKGKKTTDHDCSYYALRNSEKVCDLKSDSEEECEEITQDEYEQRHQQGQNPEEIPCNAEGSTVACDSRTVESIYNCVQTSDEGVNPIVCTQTKKTCSEAQSLTNINCNELSTNDILCITGTSGCITPTTCDDVISDASAVICEKFENCEYKAENSDGEENTKAHCKSTSTPKGCAITLDATEGQEEICNSRPKANGAICYFDGDKYCKEALKCEDIEYAEGKTVPQTKCDIYNTDTTAENKCIASSNKCTLKPYCGQETPSQHACSYYELKTAGNVCVSKQGSTTECEEITQEQYTERENAAANAACLGKTGDACTLIFSNNILINCGLEGEEGSQTCKSKGTYATCSFANALSDATNEQCLQLTHSSNTYCIKGISGCLEVEGCENISGEGITDNICGNFPVSSHQECVKNNNACKLNTKTCTDASIVYEEGICDKLGVSLENGKCYYDGAKCAEANSCQTIAETTLTGTALDTLCEEFSTETKNCVADGKKCKLEDGEGKEDEKEEGKEGEKEDEKEGEKEEGKEDGKNDGKNSSKRLTLSFVILFLVLII